MRTKQAGRASVLTILVVAAVLLGGIVMLFARVGDSPETAAQNFMTALAKGDLDSLTKLSFLENQTPEQIRKQWDFAENTAGKYYRFTYAISGSSQPDPTDATVSMQFEKNAGDPAAYPEAVTIPLVKVGQEWKVDVAAMDRTLFPALPGLDPNAVSAQSK